MSSESVSATARLAVFASNFVYDDLSEIAEARGRELLLDYFGVMLAAVGSRVATAAIAATAVHPDLPVRLAGGGGCASAGDAAFYHGALAHALEFDDSTLNPVGHPSTVILPAVLALAEARGASGLRAMQAYHAGLEVHSRLGAAQKGNWSAGAWLPIGHISLIGAAAACANLLGLDAGRCAHAIGLAVQFSGQLGVNAGSHAKPFGAGNSARAGLVAALLASEGMTAVEGVIERKGGFADTFFGPGGHDLEAALSRLGAPLHIEETGVALKRYPSCYGTHWGNDALIDILRDHRLGSGDIDSIELACPASGAFLDDPEPHDTESAKFSHQYNLAITAIEGFPRVESFDEERVASPDVRAWLRRASVRIHPADLQPPEAWQYLVTVRTVDGREIRHSVPRPLGHPRRPMSMAEVEEKFSQCAGYVLGGADAAALKACLNDIVALPDLSAIADILDRVRPKARLSEQAA